MPKVLEDMNKQCWWCDAMDTIGIYNSKGYCKICGKYKYPSSQIYIPDRVNESLKEYFERI